MVESSSLRHHNGPLGAVVRFARRILASKRGGFSLIYGLYGLEALGLLALSLASVAVLFLSLLSLGFQAFFGAIIDKLRS